MIYVDRNAPGYVQTGTSWMHAYQDLQNALMRAKKGCKNSIHMADGVYNPSDEFSENPTGDTFEIPAGVSVYGGYAGWGAADPDKCDPNRFHTILSGYVDESTNNNTVVTMGNYSLLDGLTVEEGYFRAIFGDETSFIIKRCVVKNNTQKGIESEDSDTIVQWCKICNNGWQGIDHEGSGNFLTIENCEIYDNQRDGIYADQSTSTILNTLIYENGAGSNPFNTYYGINFINPGAYTEIRNNTIVYNTNEGIRRLNGNLPDVRNCILFYNNDNEAQLTGMNLEQIYYCCIPDCNEINAQHNIKEDPGFAYTYPVYGYYHLNWDSPCRDAGDPDEQNYVEIGEVDMDMDDRAGDGTVDIGADEVTCEYYTSDPNDWNGDGVINYGEFLFLSRAWLSHDPNDPVCDPNHPNYVSDPDDPDYISEIAKANWNPICNLNDTEETETEYAIDISDLVEFCKNDPQVWGWEACWRNNYFKMCGMMDSGSGAGMMMAMPVMETFESISAQMASEPNPETMEQNILLILEEIEKYMEEEPENYEALVEMKAFLEDVLSDLEKTKNK